MHTCYAVVIIHCYRICLPFKSEMELYSYQREMIAQAIAQSIPGGIFQGCQEGLP
jgi:hypothetical protein